MEHPITFYLPTPIELFPFPIVQHDRNTNKTVMKKIIHSILISKKAYRKIILLIGVIFGFTTSIVAQYGAPMAHYRITGRVISKDCNIPIPNIKVNLSDNNYQSSYGPVTDKDGKFELWFYRDYGDTDNMKMMLEADDVDGEANGGEFKTFEKMALIKLRQEKRVRDAYNNDSPDIIIEMDYKGKPPCKPEEPTDSVIKQQPIAQQLPIDSIPKKEPPLQKLCILTDSSSLMSDEPDSLKNNIRGNPPDLPANNLIVVYPNPSKGIYTIKYSAGKSSYISIYVYDSNSKLILSQVWGNCEGIVEKQLSLEGKAPGLYYLILKADNASYTHKLVKN
jgi:putative lipoprotein (rSAM/lipoprotein system)